MLEKTKLSDTSKNLLDQQRRLQEQQQKMWQEQLRRQQMYGYLSQKRRDADAIKPSSCSICGSVSDVKSCTMCKRFFCRIHLPVKSFGNIHLPAGKTGMIGHVCILSRRRTDKLAKSRTPPRSPTKMEVKKVESGKCVSTMNKWKCPICDHLNSEDTDICEECGVYNEESGHEVRADKEDSDY